MRPKVGIEVHASTRFDTGADQNPRGVDTYTMVAKKWGVCVRRVSKRHYKTVLFVDQQSFTFMEVQDQDDAKAVCMFHKRMLLIALKNLGLDPKTASKLPRSRFV